VFKEWDCPRALATLKAFPLPADLREQSIESIIKSWRENGMKRAVGVTDIAAEFKRRIGRLLERYEAAAAYTD